MDLLVKCLEKDPLKRIMIKDILVISIGLLISI